MLNLIALALAPVVVLITFVYFNDRYDREPIGMLVLSFFLGCVSVIPAVLFSGGIERYLGWSLITDDWLALFLFAFGVVAFGEEMAKFLMLRFFIYRRKSFDEPFDGIMYTMMIGMGFAAVENLLYVLTQDTYAGSLNVAGWRAFTAVPAHATFAILMGYFVGKAKFAGRNRIALMALGILLAVGFHGSYDLFLFQTFSPGLALGALASLIAGVYYSVKAIRLHQRRSPFRNDESA